MCCEWRILPGLDSDHLPIDINLQRAPIHYSNSLVPVFNIKKAHLNEKFISDHPHTPIGNHRTITHCTAQSFSSLLLKCSQSLHFLRSSWPFLSKHDISRKWIWLCRIGGGHAPRRITSCMLRCHGERLQSSPGPKLRSGRLPAK